MTHRPMTQRLRWCLLLPGAIVLLGASGCASTPAMRPAVARNARPAGAEGNRAQRRCAGELCFSYDEASASGRH